MKIKILINGVGRIGKAILKILMKNEKFEIVAINEINPYLENIVYSINHDSTYGNISSKFKIIEDNYIENKYSIIKVLNHSSLFDIDLEGIDIIIDASGKKEDISKLKTLPVKAVFLTHPNKDADINVILGVNEDAIDINIHKVISTSSCNATALLPALKLIDKQKRFCVEIFLLFIHF